MDREIDLFGRYVVYSRRVSGTRGSGIRTRSRLWPGCQRNLPRTSTASRRAQAEPSGGPNFAQVVSSRAMDVVVNLASSECEAASGGVVKARKPKSTSIAFFLAVEELEQGTYAVGGVEDHVDRTPVDGPARSRAGLERSLVLLQPQ